VDHLTVRGVMEPELLYKSPFTDVAPQGPDQMFDDENVVRLIRNIEELNEAAVA
jgi:type I restriction enzyme, R subunit